MPRGNATAASGLEPRRGRTATPTTAHPLRTPTLGPMITRRLTAAILLAALAAAPSCGPTTPTPTDTQNPAPSPTDTAAPTTAAPAPPTDSHASLGLPDPPREFRGVWVATVANIDWPSAKALPTEQQRAEMLRILDTAAALNLNAILLQVRPACDAIYPSPLEPWSEFLTGQSGRPPDPAWDPLAEWIAAAHDRGLELHAWFNPFRARHFRSELPDAPQHITNTRPDLTRAYGQYKWLDPGEPQAQDHALRVMADVLTRYDLDGIHIDDYFYPYPERDLPFPDDASYARHTAAGGTLARPAWRENNINTFVQRMYKEVKALKPHAAVGISPFGIWRPGHPPGIKGMDAVERLHADARLWLNQGWLDYAAPQLYWAVDAKEQPFAPLLDWWAAENHLGRGLWPGLYTSCITGEPDKWQPNEILNQIAVTRRRAAPPAADAPPGGLGHIHFSMICLLTNRGGIADALREGPYQHAALTPEMPWLNLTRPDAPRLHAQGLRLAWGATSMNDVRRWVLWQRAGQSWSVSLLPASVSSTELAPGVSAAAVAAVGRAGMLGRPAVVNLETTPPPN